MIWVFLLPAGEQRGGEREALLQGRWVGQGLKWQESQSMGERHEWVNCDRSVSLRFFGLSNLSRLTSIIQPIKWHTLAQKWHKISVIMMKQKKNTAQYSEFNSKSFVQCPSPRHDRQTYKYNLVRCRQVKFIQLKNCTYINVSTCITLYINADKSIDPGECWCSGKSYRSWH